MLDGYNDYVPHLGRKCVQVMGIAGQKADSCSEGLGRDRNDRVDGVISFGTPEQFSGCPPKLRGHRLLIDSSQDGMDSGVATMTPECLGQGDAAHLYLDSELLSQAQLSPNPSLATGRPA